MAAKTEQLFRATVSQCILQGEDDVIEEFLGAPLDDSEDFDSDFEDLDDLIDDAAAEGPAGVNEAEVSAEPHKNPCIPNADTQEAAQSESDLPESGFEVKCSFCGDLDAPQCAQCAEFLTWLLYHAPSSDADGFLTSGAALGSQVTHTVLGSQVTHTVERADPAPDGSNCWFRY
ncbi:hypothetical protein B0T26DRAFT_671524 [Lasiosphaeria miniovina]|uniref:Uncharacterized protein n=1 Tax=Lasiosphaeria miniovina TaxID=1954250 RepID=A0AA40B344_9PEZI|nr:uncharacterized protein B0T26DRAFT_671524 [Lasiosphaeria miniovina]KAK0726764.1 hypothetical protein B0T26DRAFT_671524 [Lasiosphaeria miniovina]